MLGFSFIEYVLLRDFHIFFLHLFSVNYLLSGMNVEDMETWDGTFKSCYSSFLTAVFLIFGYFKMYGF